MITKRVAESDLAQDGVSKLGFQWLQQVAQAPEQ